MFNLLFFLQLCVPSLPVPGTPMTSSKPSTTLSPLSTPSKYFSVEEVEIWNQNITFSLFAKGLLLFFDLPLFVPALKIWVWFCHLHRLGWSLPDCSGGWHAGSVLPKREVYTQISHVQTPQQQRVCVNWTLIQRLIEHFHIPASHIFEKEYRRSSFYIFCFLRMLLCLLLLYFKKCIIKVMAVLLHEEQRSVLLTVSSQEVTPVKHSHKTSVIKRSCRFHWLHVRTYGKLSWAEV